MHLRHPGNMLVSPVFKRSFFLCFLLARVQRWINNSLGKTISFTLGCILKPHVSFNKIIIHSTGLGRFRCDFWISRKSLSYARKMVVDMMDWQPLCVCVCVCVCACIPVYAHVCRCPIASVYVCVCVCQENWSSYFWFIVYYVQRKQDFLFSVNHYGNEHPWALKYSKQSS